MPLPLTFAAWREILQHRGHQIEMPSPAPASGFRLWPDPEAIVTVAVEPDETLYPRWRQRYFVCELEVERMLRATGCPEHHQGRWCNLVEQQPPGYWQDFLAGPGAWTLSRLARFDAVVFWTDRGLAWSDLDNSTYRDWGMVLPAEAAPFFPVTRMKAPHPQLVPVSDERFVDVVAACFLVASVGLNDCYLADREGKEVYLAHHHDKVVVSITAPHMRNELLHELTNMGWLLTDISGYTTSMDEGDEASDDSDEEDDDLSASD